MKIYKGIKYADAVRFARPIQADNLNSIDDVETEIKICPQNPSRLDGVIGRSGYSELQSEDCLRLAVYTPSTDGCHPVLVWIHGGAYLTGSALYDIYDASRLAEEGNIVVVSISYRLGAFGFLCDPEHGIENLGIEDQVCALRWIRDNIRLFGGNPQDVTVMGQSAGAYSILHHIATITEPLFSKAIVASAPYSSVSRKTVQRNTKAFYGTLGEDPAECSVEKILEAQNVVASKGFGGMPFSAICDGVLSPDPVTPGLKAAMFWCQKDDALPFVPFRFLAKPVTDLLFYKPMLRYASHLSSKGISTSCCVRDWRHGKSEFGAVHCMELPLLFGNYGTWKDAPFMQGVTLDEYEAQSRVLRNELYSFIRNSCNMACL